MINNCVLSTNGYYIPKKNITSDQFNTIKKDLTVLPLNVDYTKEEKEVAKYKLYHISSGIIKIPRYYGIEKFGNPNNEDFNNTNTNIKFKGALRDYQVPIVDKCLKHIKKTGGGILVVPCGQGKCLGVGTPVLMFDGTINKVENIIIGDQIMGDDSLPRNILSIARGSEIMFKIYTDFEHYIVNKSHILSLKNIKTNKIIDLPVEKYLNLNNEEKNDLKGYRVGVNFKHTNLTNIEKSFKYGSYIAKTLNESGTSIIHNVLCISNVYKFCPQKEKLEFIKGFVSTYGNSFKMQNCLFVSDLIFILRSANINCAITKNQKTNIVNFSFNSPLKIIQNEYVYDIQLEELSIDNYFGFEIDGNHRFLLGDFTVTHNTSMAIYMAAQLKAKTLVITHKTFLQDQWISRCKQFTNSKIGIIRQNKIDIDGKDFVIGMIQSLSSRNYDPEIFKQFKFIICDETHHFSSKCFSKALFKCGAKYTLGLTATPYRSDGLMCVVNWYLGDIMYKKQIQTNNQVVSKIITYVSTDKLFAEKKRWIKGSIKPDCVKMINNLVDIKDRNTHICNIINELRKNSDRKILILSGRKSHLAVLKESIDNSIEEDIKNKKILENECRTYYYTGDTKRADRFEAEQYADILFATYDMAHEGLDISRLNTIVFATPKKDVVQAVGRMLRKILKIGDIRPMVIDFIDDLNVFKSQGNVREKFYEKSKYIMQYYYASDNKFISPKEYLLSKNESNDSLTDTFPKKYSDLLEVSQVDIEESCNNDEPEEENINKIQKNKVTKYKNNANVFMFGKKN